MRLYFDVREHLPLELLEGVRVGSQFDFLDGHNIFLIFADVDIPCAATADHFLEQHLVGVHDNFLVLGDGFDEFV